MSNTPTKHSKLAASFCEAWWNCPGSIRETQHHETKPSIYLAEGTVAHDLAADCLLKDWDNDKLDTFIGVVKDQDGFEIEVTEEMVDAIWMYVEFVRSHLIDGAMLIVEKTIKMPNIHEALFATPDAVVIWPYDKVFVFDLKYGAGRKVSAWKNKQLLYYACYYFMQEDVDVVSLNIVQPRIEGENISSFEVDAEYMEDHIKQLKIKAKEALKKDAPLNAGPWCQKSFCSALSTCPAAQDKVYEIVAKDFDDAPNPESLNIEQIVKVLEWTDFLKNWLSAVTGYAKEMALQGENIPGYKLVKSLGNTKWKSEEAVIADLEPKYGDKIYAPAKLKSPTQMKKIIKKEEVENYSFRPESGIKLVPETAKGEPLKLNTASSDFDDV